jgi:hypothetical protein
MPRELKYKTAGTQTAYYTDGKGQKVPGETLAPDTVLNLRNICCHILPENNVFEIEGRPGFYVTLDADQVSYIEGSQGFRFD